MMGSDVDSPVQPLGRRGAVDEGKHLISDCWTSYRHGSQALPSAGNVPGTAA